MTQPHSYFSRPYAPAWGILIGTAVGVAIDFAVPSSGPGLIIGVLSLTGLLIGYVISQSEKKHGMHDKSIAANNIEARLRTIDELRSRNVLTADEYQRKREEIVSQL